MPDEELVRELQSHRGDGSDAENAAARLMMERCKPEIDAILLRMGIGWHDLPELEQIVFIQVLQKIDQLRDPKRFHAWVRSIARHMALNFTIRDRQHGERRPVSLALANGEDLEIEGDPSDNPLVQLLHGERQRLLFAALGAMKPNDRLVLQQFYLRGMSLNEIVDEGGGEAVLPLGTVKRRLHTARSRLLELMSIQMAD